MALNLINTPDREELKPRITVFGVGGAGGNAVNNMIEQNLEGVEFVVANTDAQALQQSRAPSKIQMGIKVTEGLGAGARPTVGAAAAEETIEEIVDHLAGSHMCFITAGMGGGTGTGAAPIIAQAARELGVLTVGVVTKPFSFEGNKRMRQAEEGIAALQKVVDTLIIIPNQNLFRLANDRTTFAEAFGMADDVLYQGVKGVTDLMVRPGLINLDFADVRAVMDEMGKAMMGTGEASGENRARQAAEKAIANPLLDEISLHGAKGFLINVTGGHDLTLFELDEAANIIREKVDPDANIIVGSTMDPSMDGVMRVSVVATGIDVNQSRTEIPAPRRTMAEPLRPMPVEAAPMELSRPAEARPVETRPTVPSDLFETARHNFADRREPEDVLNDEIPPPAYVAPAYAPRPVQPAPQMATPHEDDLSNFMAPKPRQAGVPSAEALQRLREAVEKSPAKSRPLPSTMTRPVQPAPKVAERPRFGIGSLINRMSSGAADAPAQTLGSPTLGSPTLGSPTLGRTQPPVTSTPSGYDDEQDLSGDHERIEIPAFLRRQAN
jgi:cell division protein FtsZ